MADSSDRLHRFDAGDLSPMEERELAQAALQDPDLFDELMTAAAATAAMRSQRVPPRTSTIPLRRARLTARRVLVACGALAAAAAVAVAVLPSRGRNAARTSPSSRRIAAASPRSTPPAHAPGRTGSASPVILAARLEDLGGRSTADFRSAASASRPPKARGEITSVRDSEVLLTVGSLDGVTQGAELPVLRGSPDGPTIGRVVIDTAFREQSRGRATAATVQRGDIVVLPAALQAAALVQRMTALIAAGDVAAARAAGNQALALPANQVAVDDRRRALMLVGTLEHHAGDLAAALEHLSAAAALAARPPAAPKEERADLLNELGAVLLENGRVDEAERRLQAAAADASGATAAHVANNLGAAAALRGDGSAAAEQYRLALTLLDASTRADEERRAIEHNLALLSDVK